MKFMLIFASVVAVVVAIPHRGVVEPGAAGPAPAPETEPIAIGPAILDYEPVAIGPAIVEQPVIPAPAPAPVLPEVIVPPVPAGNPVVQIILNINGQVAGPGVVVPQPPIGVVPADPVHIVDTAPEPVDIGPAIVPEPVDIGPAIVPEPVSIGVPVVPHPAVNLPEELN